MIRYFIIVLIVDDQKLCNLIVPTAEIPISVKIGDFIIY
jgi:hypothetical protein